MASEEAGGNLMVAEQTLIAPAFRCFVLLDTDIKEQKKLYENILTYQAEFVPYLGKNECSVWWSNAKEHNNYSEFKPEGVFKIDSLFVKEEALIQGVKKTRFVPGIRRDFSNLPFVYFENLPHSYMGAPLFQYSFKPFAFTNSELKEEYSPSNSFQLLKTEMNVIQIY
jgi:CRISPR-associated protein Cas5h